MFCVFVHRHSSSSSSSLKTYLCFWLWTLFLQNISDSLSWVYDIALMEKSEADSCSPTCVLEDFLRSSESEPKTSDSEAKQDPKPASRWLGFVKSLKNRSKKQLDTLHSFSSIKNTIRKCSSMRETGSMVPSFLLGASSCSDAGSSWKNYSLHELNAATNNFSQENLIGKGGYAEVYKGRLRDGRLVAIKQLTRGTPDEMVGGFLSELGIMAHVNHPNTAKLIGYGVDGKMHLVLELSPYGSLASMLYGPKEKLKWGVRFKIARGTAKGLLYLHEDCQRRIIHRDIKAANILLSYDFEPQICDFGLAKWLPEQWTHHTVSNFEGTFGYLAPEYLMHGIVDEKTDVYAFGVLLLELVTGRRAIDYSQQSVVLWAKPLLKKNVVRELVDPGIGNDYDSRQVILVLLAASLCIQQSSIRRPSMRQVSDLLSGDLACLQSMKKRRIQLYRRALRRGSNSE